jgi:hypothetical protein
LAGRVCAATKSRQRACTTLWNGGTMLDNTLIFLFSEVGQWHEHDDVPMAQGSAPELFG